MTSAPLGYNCSDTTYRSHLPLAARYCRISVRELAVNGRRAARSRSHDVKKRRRGVQPPAGLDPQHMKSTRIVTWIARRTIGTSFPTRRAGPRRRSPWLAITRSAIETFESGRTRGSRGARSHGGDKTERELIDIVMETARAVFVEFGTEDLVAVVRADAPYNTFFGPRTREQHSRRSCAHSASRGPDARPSRRGQVHAG
jgi:hypothetical protein